MEREGVDSIRCRAQGLEMRQCTLGGRGMWAGEGLLGLRGHGADLTSTSSANQRVVWLSHKSQYHSALVSQCHSAIVSQCHKSQESKRSQRMVWPSHKSRYHTPQANMSRESKRSHSLMRPELRSAGPVAQALSRTGTPTRALSLHNDPLSLYTSPLSLYTRPLLGSSSQRARDCSHPRSASSTSAPASSEGSTTGPVSSPLMGTLTPKVRPGDEEDTTGKVVQAKMAGIKQVRQTPGVPWIDHHAMGTLVPKVCPADQESCKGKVVRAKMAGFKQVRRTPSVPEADHHAMVT